MPNMSPLEIFKILYPDRLRAADNLGLYSAHLVDGFESTHWCYNLHQADRLSLTFHNTRRLEIGIGLLNRARALAIGREHDRATPPRLVRGCEAAVSAVPGLWVVIPYGTGPSRSDSDAAAVLPPDLRQALDLAGAVWRPPSIVISTPGAVYVCWLLDRLWLFDLDAETATDPADARALIDRLQGSAHRLAAEHGWQIPAAGNLAAAFPVPGSLAGPNAEGPRVVLEQLSQEIRYHRSDFESLPEPTAEPRPLDAGPPAETSGPCPASATPPSPEPPPTEPQGGREAVAEARPRILITPEHHDVNDQALDALAAAGALFVHAGTLVEIVRAPGAPPTIHRVRAPRFRELLSRHAVFLKLPANGGDPYPVAPPPWTVATVMARGCWPLPRLPRDMEPAAREPAEGLPIEAGDLSGEATAEATGLLAALEQTLGALGGAALARDVVRAVATEPERHPDLAAVFARLRPELDPTAPAAATALGWRLRGLRGRVFGGRVLLKSRRARNGIVWTVRRPQTPGNRKEAAAS